MPDIPQDPRWERVLEVLRYVSRGRRYVDAEPYPDATARHALAELEDHLAVRNPCPLGEGGRSVYVRLSNERVDRTEPARNFGCLNFDLDADDCLVGVEVLHAKGVTIDGWAAVSSPPRQEG